MKLQLSSDQFKSNDALKICIPFLLLLLIPDC